MLSHPSRAHSKGKKISPSIPKGTYCGGARDGETCVFKWFMTGSVVSETYFSMDIKATDKAIEIVRKWNEEKMVGQIVLVNEAQVWAIQDVCPGLGDGPSNRSPPAGERCLVEPFIENFRKFNSNCGWCDCSSLWARLMQALSHYSYHISKGELLLCDLQVNSRYPDFEKSVPRDQSSPGGCYQNGVVLTDPVIMSHDRRYGVKDLGTVGISNFFANHQCNEFCRDYWLKLREAKRTSMKPYQGPNAERPMEFGLLVLGNI
ncbi:hypothetical protein BSKO_02573 [Bryopsis sp. KO-2023]|nr:hypothetical protein BSKO_02573 [Bryopsis sp. KO-2023]